MKEQSAAGILETTIEKVKNLVNVSTIIGEPMNIDGGITIIPVSKVTYGFASGGSDFPSKTNKEIFGGGGGAGVTITPVAFLVISDGEVTIKHITAFDNAAERVVNLLPKCSIRLLPLLIRQRRKRKKQLLMMPRSMFPQFPQRMLLPRTNKRFSNFIIINLPPAYFKNMAGG